MIIVAEEEEEEASGVTEGEKENDNGDEYNFDQYDEEDVKQDALMGIGNLAVYSSNTGDPYVTLPDEDDNDSEKEDDIINPKDNLVLVGHVEGDASILEVYVYNEEEGSLYVHHDILLPAFPLCLEWLNHDPEDKKPGNLCAIGTMSPVIEVWDIDIVDCLESVLKLGHRGNKRKGIAKYGHRDAVLDLSWNKNVTHVLASGSADRTVLLWDLDTAKYASKLTSFEDKVQTLQWHPFEEQTLLVGSCDRIARVFDCRVNDAHKDWEVAGEVEKVLWNHFNPYNFIVGTSSGSIHYIDCRNDKPLWELSAHTKEVAEGCLKVWDIQEGTPSLVYTKEPNLGTLLCLDACPDLPYVVCIGGDNKKHNFAVIDAMNSTTGNSLND
ncbi:Periodic tryptophan protein 1 [Blattella germanica]|nr:Periodic tryptophan protein 1 [Blattella germanica]